MICPKHGEFPQTPHSHLRGAGCPFCVKIKKINQNIVKKFLIDNNINFEEEYNVQLPINITCSRIDFYIPFLNLFVEYNGRQHYELVHFNSSNEKAIENFKKQQLRDKQLREYCKNNNINLLEIDGRVYTGAKLEQFLAEHFSSLLFLFNLCS
jgi:hypothetical protein